MTRRSALKGALGASGRVLAVGAGAGAVPSPTEHVQDDDAAILHGLVRFEELTALAYDAAARGGALRGLARSGAEYVRDQEREHARRLMEELERLGGTRPAAPRPDDLPGMERLSGDRRFARFLLRLEGLALEAYRDAHRGLRSLQALALVTSVMAAEGQHVAMLRLELGREPVPRPFEPGPPGR